MRPVAWGDTQAPPVMLTMHCKHCERLTECKVKLPIPSGPGATGICPDCEATRR